MLLWALLLTLTAQGAGAGEPPELPSMPPWGRCPSPELQAQQWPHVNVTTPIWDNPVCTKSVVVTRGARAEMTCNSCNPIRKVMVCLRAPGREVCQPIFTQATPGCSSRDGWRLCVQGCSAKMVTEEAQDSQAGRYSWILLGRQRELKSTTLNVSEPPELPSTPFWERAGGEPGGGGESGCPAKSRLLRKKESPAPAAPARPWQERPLHTPRGPSEPRPEPPSPVLVPGAASGSHKGPRLCGRVCGPSPCHRPLQSGGCPSSLAGGHSAGPPCRGEAVPPLHGHPRGGLHQHHLLRPRERDPAGGPPEAEPPAGDAEGDVLRRREHPHCG
ncbi:Secreted and transmembrane protein 1 [Myotis davidii]|uniref:Secreted and transmembrane protein 1 n=1 Tax=Myotis davidii TaxID=225400 RepID=L5MKQ7_MYODS|nr:Secreted and transmembrane protein 1 [Myotis davidii]